MRINACDLLDAGAPGAVALIERERRIDYAQLREAVARAAGGLAALGLARGERVGIVADKTFEAVTALFGAMHAGLVAVPLNPLLKAAQVGHVARDCGMRALCAASARWRVLARDGLAFDGLRVALDRPGAPGAATQEPDGSDRPHEPGRHASPHGPWHDWADLIERAAPAEAARVVDADAAAILYTSGSTGLPKGVVLSHRNLVAGAESVSSYLRNDAHDRILAALPLSFDAGLSQLTTAFSVGATAVLHEYLLAQDCVRAIAAHRITGLTAVPPLWMQLAARAWPPGAGASLRYFANTGGRMPRALLAKLRALAPQAEPFLMYGLTEAFRSTYLPPSEVDRRPDSIGCAIPGAQILVLRPDGTPCAPGEPGELVHRGATVALGYWNDPQRTAERFRPLPAACGVPLAETAVWSGDTVVRDAEGFLYFVGRRDEMIKTSGYRVSPTEVEEALYASGLVAECAVFGRPDEALGQAVVAVAVPVPHAPADWTARALDACRAQLPGWMVPQALRAQDAPLPRSANGKIDRRALADATGRG